MIRNRFRQVPFSWTTNNLIRKQRKPLSSISSWSAEEVVEYDKAHVFHPYTSMTHPLAAHLVKSAKGVYLELEDGRKVIDGMSSWWAVVHGYRHPKLDEAIKSQVDKMSHVMFGGITHRPAVELVHRLVEMSPDGLEKVFLSDTGSVSVEVGIKMALQYWFRVGKTSKTKLATVRSGYHGDTFAAMSVCDPVNGMHDMFSDVLMKNHFADAPNCSFFNPPPPGAPCSSIDSVETILKEHGDEIAAFILEPIVQGTGGMRMYSPHFLRKVREMCDKYDVLLIADEIATGFGRTGEMFACNHAGITPDILCLGKALTGGYMTLAATLTTARVAEGVSQNGGVFNHGPTYMANPLACSVANASLELLQGSDWRGSVRRVEEQLGRELEPLRHHRAVEDVRVLGAIGVCELKDPIADMAQVQRMLVEEGVWLRPFGKLLYTMPTFNCPTLEPSHISQITNAMKVVCDSQSR